MDNDKIEARIKRRIRMQTSNDKMLKLFVLVFVLAYIFFFSSRLIFPRVYRGVEATPVGSVLGLGDQIFTFDAWDYSKKDNLFEILIEVEDLSLEKQPDIEFSCMIGSDLLKVKTDRIIDGNLYVLRVEKVPGNFTTATLSITTTDQTEGASETGKFYMDDKHAGSISSATTDTDYLIYAANCKIRGYKKEIRRLQKEQDELQEKVTYSVTKIEKLEEEKKLQTEAERQETDSNISKVAYEAEELQSKIEENAVAIDELEEKIELQRQLLRTLEGGDGH